MEAIRQAIKTNRAYFCLDCGKCTSVCPISWRDAEFSPRGLVESIRLDGSGRVLRDNRIWECLTCGRCTQICPSDVRFLDFVRDVRAAARCASQSGHCSHGATIQTWMRIMAKPALQQNRLGWLTDDLRVADPGRSDTVYFVGCLPYYDALFGRLGVAAAEIARSAVRVLNFLGIEPTVLADERCCGHDLLWEGEMDTFQRLRALNTELLRETGAKRIVTTCPECARTLKLDHSLGMEILHISELLVENASRIPNLQSPTSNIQLTYHDPCRLGRHLEVYDAPRQVMEALGLELVEMERNRGRAVCCGTSAWTQCGATAKAIQVDRLREAAATGADMLVTACVKCQIHFKCAQDDDRLGEELRLEIRDLTTLVAESWELGERRMMDDE